MGGKKSVVTLSITSNQARVPIKHFLYVGCSSRNLLPVALQSDGGYTKEQVSSG